ncbi:MAG: hypothetical protein LWX83_06490 [Anaerolineae bacterium]|nr:hypothetical protein [Anaerolineae bacterium]
MENEVEKEETSKFETIISILIAIVVVLGALVSWRASLIDDSSGDNDYGGIKSAVSAEQARALNYVNAYSDYGNYVNYWKNSRLSTLISEDIAKNGDEDPVLDAQVKTANDIVDSSSDMFKMRYLNRDRSYNIQRQLGEMWADASKKSDLDYEAQFKSADEDRARTRLMLVALMILTVSPIFYTLIESSENPKYKYAMAILGTLFMIGGALMAFLVEFKMI